jgi:hypothetical protein
MSFYQTARRHILEVLSDSIFVFAQRAGQHVLVLNELFIFVFNYKESDGNFIAPRKELI